MARKEKIAVIINTGSSKSKPGKLKKQIDKILPDADVLVGNTKKSIQLFTKKKLREGYNIFIVAGGDGTVSLVANFLVNKNCKLCIIPTGTRNEIASVLKIKKNSKKILKNVAENNFIVKKIDTIETNLGNFLLNISVGLTSQIIHKSKPAYKKLFGHRSYFVIAGVQYLKSEEIDLDVKIDGVRFSTKALDLMINNFGMENLMNIKNIAKARIDNGILECFIVKPSNVLTHISFFMGEKGEDIKHTIVKKEIEVNVKSEIPVQADGDIIRTKIIKARLNKKSLNVLVPN